MYSRTVTAQQVAAAELEIGRPIVYYSYDYIRACIDHLDSLAIRDDKHRVTGTKRPLAPDEIEFIANERLLCGLDYLHWAENYHYVRDKETLAMVPFRQNTYQKVLTLAQGQLEEQGKPVIVQLLKARQGGGTTDTTSKIEHRMLFVPNTAAVIASSDPEKSWKLSEMISRSLTKQPWWLIPPNLKEYQSGEVFLDCFERNSYVSIQHGTQGTGISRGDTVNCFHLSELPDFDNPDLIVDDSLFGAWHPTPLHFGVLESTAKGRKNWWHTLWLTNKENWELGRTLQRPLFLPYYVSPEIYPTEGWLAAIPIPRDYVPSDYVKEHARRAAEYVHSDPFLRQVLGADWRMSVKMQWWYQFSYEEAIRKDKLGNFLSEYPATDTEAFQSQSKSVFSIQLIQDYESKVPQPVGVFKLTGSDLPRAIAPDSGELLEGSDGKQISITHQSPSDELRWNLHPVRFPGYSSVNSHLNTLWVWEYPIENESYCVYLDGAQGIGRDRTVLGVLRKGTVDRPAGQVACFSSDSLSTLDVWPIALLLLNYYSPWSDFKRDVNRALFSPEVRADGAGCLMEVRKRGWNRIYFRRQRDNRKQQNETITKLGWDTTPGDGGTRALLIHWLLTTIKGQFVEINSPWTIDEMRDFVVIESETTNKIKIEHDKGAHDDELFGLGIGIVTLHDLDVYRGETPQWRAMKQELEQLVKFASYNDVAMKFDPRMLDPELEKAVGGMYPLKVIGEKE
jgi:hypothetical protein